MLQLHASDLTPWSTAAWALAGTDIWSCLHVVFPLSHNRCLIREAQGGSYTSYQMKNHQPLSGDAGSFCGCCGHNAASSEHFITILKMRTEI